MRQILQNLGNGETILADVPKPRNEEGHLLIRSKSSLISIGTEKILIDFGKSSFLDKARKQPDKVRQVIQKIKTDGLAATYNAVSSKLNQPIPLGYSNAGIVEEATSLDSFSIGDRVISNGPHAEYVSVPKNLCAVIPENVSFDQASFTVVGSIGLQGIRLLNPTLGEVIAVTGLGLIGLLCVQMLKAQGCRVLGIDFDSKKCEIARHYGAETVDLSKGEDPIAAGMAFSRGIGMDGVIITASTTSNTPVQQAANMSRKRGRIVLVGVAGLQLSRADFYEKELSFQVSCSYGPGRYDSNYEEKVQDYPIGFVRWTEQRNFEAFLQLLSDKRLDVDTLITNRYEFQDSLKAYLDLLGGNALGVVLNYSQNDHQDVSSSKINNRVKLEVSLNTNEREKTSSVCVGYIGAGGFSNQVLLPALSKTSARFKTIVSTKGVTGTHLGKKFGFEQSSTDVDSVISDADVNTVVITTRHDSHACYVIAALKAGKNVFVEKPLCLNPDELSKIETAYHSLSSQKNANKPFLMVGFNRRFSPHVVKMKSLLASVKDPKAMIMTVNAGAIQADHWTQDPSIGGGRIIGECCHFIDLLRFIADSSIVVVRKSFCGQQYSEGCQDSVIVTLEFSDGSVGTIHYLTNGDRSVPKERLEVFVGGRVLQLDNFRRLTGYGWSNFKKMNLWAQDKGHLAEMETLVNAVYGGKPCPIPFGEILEVTKSSFVASNLFSEG